MKVKIMSILLILEEVMKAHKHATITECHLCFKGKFNLALYFRSKNFAEISFEHYYKCRNTICYCSHIYVICGKP